MEISSALTLFAAPPPPPAPCRLAPGAYDNAQTHGSITKELFEKKRYRKNSPGFSSSAAREPWFVASF